MESIGTLGLKLIASIVQHEVNPLQFQRLGLSKDLFSGEEEKGLFLELESHISKYGVVPTEDTAIEMGIDLSLDLEPPSYYLSKVESRALHQKVKKALLSSQESLKSREPEEALTILTDLVYSQIQHKYKNTLVNFTKEGHDLIKSDYVTRMLMGDMYGVRFGYDYLDSMTLGLTEGDLAAIIGRPAQGKTYQMLHMAHYNWFHQKKVPMFVSMEMKPLPLAQRLTAMHTHKPISHLKKSELSTSSYKGMLNVLSKISGTERDFWIVDGNLTARVQDIEVLAHQLKPDVILVDGAYLLKASKNFSSNWERIADTCEAMKQRIASDLGIPTIASYQFNRAAVDSKSKGGLEHIAGADVIPQIASIVLGNYQEEGVETLKERLIKILKGRNGETGEFRIRWFFDEMSDKNKFMDFSEITKEEQELENATDLGWV